MTIHDVDNRPTPNSRHTVRVGDAGHQNPERDDDAARTIGETREYLDVAEQTLDEEKTAVDFYHAMIGRYPNWLGRTVLWSTAQAIYSIREHPGEDAVQFIAGGWL